MWVRPLIRPRLITDVTASDISHLAEHAKATVVKRRSARGGRGAADHLIGALRCPYKYAVAHRQSRGGLAPGRPLLRYANGGPITSRRYDYLWRCLGRHLPRVATQQVRTHWIRHTTLTWVERNFGFATAQAYAGHEDHGRGGRAMATYIRAGLPEVAAALAALTGEDHPLAASPPHRTVPIPSPPG